LDSFSPITRMPLVKPQTHESKATLYLVAVDAVRSELFSAQNSLLTGKNTGNLALWLDPSRR
jgi:hypothetical protein